MKKIFLLVLLAVFQSTLAFAMSAGSGKTLPTNEYALGFDYNTIFSKDMTPESSARSGASIEGSDQFYGTVTYGLMNNGQFSANLSGKIGGAGLTLASTNVATSKLETLEYGQGFLWGLGGSVAYLFESQLKVSLNGGFNQWKASLDGIEYDGRNASTIGGSPQATVTEFQTALLFSKEIKTRHTNLTFVPYAGPSFNLTEVHTGDVNYVAGSFTGTRTDVGMKRDSNTLGLIIGLEAYTLNEAWKLAIEARFFNEEALTLSIHYKF